MYQTLNSTLSADEKLSRLTKQAALNLSMHFLRLNLITTGFSVGVDKFSGIERDYVVGILYTINENLAVLNFAGAKELVDAVFMNQLDARDWYDRAIQEVHEACMNHEAVVHDMEEFEKIMERLNPKPKGQPMPDELGDDVALTEGDKSKMYEDEELGEDDLHEAGDGLAEEGLAAIAGAKH